MFGLILDTTKLENNQGIVAKDFHDTNILKHFNLFSHFLWLYLSNEHSLLENRF